jgi:hypothetical protein
MKEKAENALRWLTGSWLLLVLWLLNVVLLAAVIGDVFLPVPSNASQTTGKLREAALPLFGSGFFGLFVFTLQTTRGRLERRYDLRRNASGLLMAAVQTLLELQRELKHFPKGRPQLPLPEQGPVKLGNFERADELEQEWRRLYREGERDLILDEGPEGATFKIWRTLRDSFWDWSNALAERGDAAKLQELEGALNANAKAFGEQLRSALRSLG